MHWGVRSKEIYGGDLFGPNAECSDVEIWDRCGLLASALSGLGKNK